MTDIKFNLQRSKYFNNRSKLLASHGAPKLSDAKANLGDSLAKVVFDQCDEALRNDFGLKFPLKGPGDILWVSPSDLLIGKIALKPPFTPKCLQALTHKGILEIGVNLENRFRQEMELDKQRTLEKYKDALLATIEDRMKSEIKDVEIRERLNCHMEMEKQQQEFELVLKYELDKLGHKMQEHYEKIITNNEDKLKKRWEENLQEEVKHTVEDMTRAFLTQLDEQEEKLTNTFKLELRKKEILRDFDAKLHKSKMFEALRTLKHNLQCTNLVNMMYIICTERRKCCEMKQNIENYYKKIISDLQENNLQKVKKITKLTKEKEHQIAEVRLRETCLQEVIKHFQKFINFALRAAPTQAEFLLSVEKMMAFELTDVVGKLEFSEVQEEQLVIPWQYESKTETSSVLSNLELLDHHNCLNELNPPTPKDGSEIGEDSTLPAIYFKDHMYVREDFRDMLSTGIKIKPSNEVWNKDVELLVENWRKQSNEATQAEAPKEQYSIESLDESSQEKIREDNLSFSNARRRSKQSTVQFVDLGTSESRRKSSESRKASRKSSLRPALFPLTELPLEPVNLRSSNSKILAAKDSLELIVEQKQKSGIYLTENIMDDNSSITAEHLKSSLDDETDSKENKELVVETRDSVFLRKTSLAKQVSTEFNASTKDSIEVAKYSIDKEFEVKSKPSKLISARNSVEILRESLLKLREPALICQKKDQRESSTPTLGFSETCCERCKRKDGSDTEEIKEESKIEKTDSLSDEKSVKITQVQIINLDDYITAPSVVSFHSEPQIFESQNFLEPSVETKIPHKKSCESKFKKIPKSRNVPKLKVVGDPHAKEWEQTNDEFTTDRIHSLLSLMKDHPQLMQLFTAGSR